MAGTATDGDGYGININTLVPLVQLLLLLLLLILVVIQLPNSGGSQTYMHDVGIVVSGNKVHLEHTATCECGE